ncbi:MAG: phenylacetate-CoA oxygenase/reductase subunit PaaK [Saprospiraceae bacterium]|nr:phenylacetate-CoA oxygenase/reductase subunit PaaK [Saprospiraceae bacterium]
MRPEFHRLQVKEIEKETDDCVSLTFLVPHELQEDFQYTQGQYLTLRSQIFGEEIRRAYSLCSSPLDGEWRVAIKKIPKGKFSSYANDVLQVGDGLEVLPPQGKFFTPFSKGQKKNYLFFAAGSGITPILSILKTGLKVEDQSEFTLVYGNKGIQSVIFFEELEALKNQYLDRLSIHHVFSREFTEAPVNSGRIDEGKLKQLARGLVDFESVDDVFICGPVGMTETLKENLPGLGVSKESIHVELFANPDQELGRETVYEAPKEIADTESEVFITLDGKTVSFPLTFGGKNILDASMEKGLDLPYACKGGVCSTCRAKLVEGEVDMPVNYALEPYELEAGFILTCQSHPRSEKIVVDFDQQ